LSTRIAINGLDRIGIDILRIISENKEDIDVVAINSTGNPEMDAHLFMYDPLYGVYRGDVKYTDRSLVIDGKEILYFQENDPSKLPWRDLNIDVVIEASGESNSNDAAGKHIYAGAKKVVITSPADNVDATIVMGVNHNTYNPEKHNIISLSSCAINCLAPIAQIMHKKFHIIKGNITIIHPYTVNNSTLDISHIDRRMATAANLSIIPTTTGVARSIGTIIPELQGKFNGISLMVPTSAVSLADLNIMICKQTNVVEINEYLKEMADGPYKGILSYCEKPLVSVNFKGNPHSAIIDSLSTMVVDGNMVKMLAWYDNEYGYCNRVIDFIKYIASK